MRLKICCCYCTDEGPTFTATEGSSGTTLPRVVAEQPKLSQSTQLDKITHPSAGESADRSKEGNQVAAATEVIPDKGSEVENVQNIEPEHTAPLSGSARTGTEALRDIQVVKSVATVPATAAPLQNEPSTPSVDACDSAEVEEQQFEVSNSTTQQNNSKVSFTVIAPGHFKSVYKDTEFYILNGQLERVNGACDESDKQFMMAQYARAMQGVERAMLGLQKGLLGMQRNCPQSSQPSVHDMLASLLPPPRPPSPPRPPQRVPEEEVQKFLARLKDEIKKGREGLEDSDSVDNLGGYIAEPALEKTTFTPKEAVYEDPETFENLDPFEVPDAKRADEYIISRDERLDSQSGYYFHTARPQRVRRKTLDPKERLRIASPGRYLLFESECLKAHNKYRSMHGVPPLVNNPFLCKVAREWAEHLALNDAFYHRPKNEYGENLYKADRLQVSAMKAVSAWYDEIELYDYKNPKFEKATGHFTQLIWKDTREVGTGVAQIGDKIWVCCNYHPPGNYTDKFNEEYVPRPVVISRKS